MYNRKIVHYVADDAKKRVNAAFLIGAYSVRLLLSLLVRQTCVAFVYIVIVIIGSAKEDSFTQHLSVDTHTLRFNGHFSR